MKKDKSISRLAATLFIKKIEELCIFYGLNLTIHDGGIGFVDQENRKIVAVWKPQYKMENTDE